MHTLKQNTKYEINNQAGTIHKVHSCAPKSNLPLMRIETGEVHAHLQSHHVGESSFNWTSESHRRISTFIYRLQLNGPSPMASSGDIDAQQSARTVRNLTQICNFLFWRNGGNSFNPAVPSLCFPPWIDVQDLLAKFSEHMYAQDQMIITSGNRT